MKPVQISISAQLREDLKAAKREATWEIFLRELLARDGREEAVHKAGESPLGMVTEEEALKAVLEALSNTVGPRSAGECLRIGEPYKIRQAENILKQASFQARMTSREEGGTGGDISLVAEEEREAELDAQTQTEDDKGNVGDQAFPDGFDDEEAL